jgi:hypothetical protein
MATWADEYITLIEDCEKREERLSDWERGFIDSLRRQIEAGRHRSRHGRERCGCGAEAEAPRAGGCGRGGLRLNVELSGPPR